MLDVSKETNVRFLRAAVKHLQERLLTQERTVLTLTAAKALDDELCQKLSDELLVLRRKFFVGGREKRPDVKSRSNSRGKLLTHNRRPLELAAPAPIELETEEIVHAGSPPVCACSQPMAPMTNGFEESCEINVTERKYTLRRHKRQKYVCRCCGKIVAADGPAKLTPGAQFSIQMAAQVADDKFSQHLPLNRQAEQMARCGLTIGTKTLFSLTEHLASRLSTVPGMIRTEILSRPSVGIDESPMRLLADDQGGYVWSISNNYGAYYQYETTRSGKVAKEMLRGYCGNVMSDGFGGYNFLNKIDDVVHVACWAHVRRGFYDAAPKYPEAMPVVKLIDELYDVEHAAADLDALSTLRRERSANIVARLDEYLEGRRGKFLDSGTFGKAVAYYRDRLGLLHRFLVDANVPLDNNGAERAQRTPVMGRNNFLGFRTINGADVGMTFYTIIKTCKMLGIDAKSYMIVMATRAAKSEQIVTPFKWGQELAVAAAQRPNSDPPIMTS